MATPTPGDEKVTGDCYDEAASELLLFSRKREGWVLAHGRPTLMREPYCEYGHAWLEKDEVVFDPTTGFEGPRFVYYSIGQISHEDVMLYTAKEARAMIKRYEHWGCWEGVDADETLTPPPRTLKATRPLSLHDVMAKGLG